MPKLEQSASAARSNNSGEDVHPPPSQLPPRRSVRISTRREQSEAMVSVLAPNSPPTRNADAAKNKGNGARQGKVQKKPAATAGASPKKRTRRVVKGLEGLVEEHEGDVQPEATLNGKRKAAADILKKGTKKSKGNADDGQTATVSDAQRKGGQSKPSEDTARNVTMNGNALILPKQVERASFRGRNNKGPPPILPSALLPSTDLDDSDDDAELLMDPTSFMWKNSLTSKKNTRKKHVVRPRRDAAVWLKKGGLTDSPKQAVSGSDSDSDRGDASLKIPGEGVLAYFSDDKRYYPAQVESYNAATRKYKVNFFSGYSRSLPRDKFHTRFEPAFSKVEVGHVDKEYYSQGIPNKDYNDPALRSDIKAVLPSIQEIATASVSTHRRCEEYFGGYIKKLEREMCYGPFDMHEVEMIIRVLKKEIFGQDGHKDEDTDGDEAEDEPVRKQIEEAENDRTMGIDQQESPGRLPSPPPSQTSHPMKSATMDVNTDFPSVASSAADTIGTCSPEVTPSVSAATDADSVKLPRRLAEGTPQSILKSPSRTDRFIRLVLLPETLIRILIHRSSNNLKYPEAEEELIVSARTTRLPWVEEIMTALDCVVMGERINKRKGQIGV